MDGYHWNAMKQFFLWCGKKRWKTRLKRKKGWRRKRDVYLLLWYHCKDVFNVCPSALQCQTMLLFFYFVYYFMHGMQTMLRKSLYFQAELSKAFNYSHRINRSQLHHYHICKSPFFCSCTPFRSLRSYSMADRVNGKLRMFNVSQRYMTIIWSFASKSDLNFSIIISLAINRCATATISNAIVL